MTDIKRRYNYERQTPWEVMLYLKDHATYGWVDIYYSKSCATKLDVLNAVLEEQGGNVVVVSIEKIEE